MIRYRGLETTGYAPSTCYLLSMKFCPIVSYYYHNVFMKCRKSTLSVVHSLLTEPCWKCTVYITCSVVATLIFTQLKLLMVMCNAFY